MSLTQLAPLPTLPCLNAGVCVTGAPGERLVDGRIVWSKSQGGDDGRIEAMHDG